MGFKIFLSPPHMGGKEQEYVNQAFESNWIAPYGPHLNEFEKEVAQYTDVEAALALSSGTAAIHLALRWFGVEPGDYVFCQDFTFIGSCDAILYERAIPVFIDSEEDSWNMSPQALERALRWAEEQGKLPKAVIICDLYGESADWDALLPICRKYRVPVIEDSAEAQGSTYKNRQCGSFGDIGIFSFNGNKIVTTSGGGMAVSSNKLAIEKMRFWATQAREPVIWYEHKDFGYNYRMSNVCAGIGRGQLDFLPKKLETRKAINDRYREAFKGQPCRIKEIRCGVSNHWLSMLCLDTDVITPNELVTRLQNAEIESRPAWKPMHLQPLFQDAPFFPHEEGRCVDEEVFNCAVCLPSGDGMTQEEQGKVIDEILRCFAQLKR